MDSKNLEGITLTTGASIYEMPNGKFFFNIVHTSNLEALNDEYPFPATFTSRKEAEDVANEVVPAMHRRRFSMVNAVANFVVGARAVAKEAKTDD